MYKELFIFVSFAASLSANVSSAPLLPLGGAGIVAEGFRHTCAIVAGGALMCWGDNGAGQLGDGSMTNSAVPVPVKGLGAGVTAVAAGHSHTCAIVAGTVRCWGNNKDAQLGDGTHTSSVLPVAVANLPAGVTAVSVGDLHSCAIAGGQAWCWGNNSFGQLGDGSGLERPTPVAIASLGNSVDAIVAGVLHTCAIVDGAAACWGDNISGQVGSGDLDEFLFSPVPVFGLGSGVSAIAASGVHTCAITSGGAMKCWGANESGQIGDNSHRPRTQPVFVLGIPPVRDIALGTQHTCAIGTNDQTYCWGGNVYGQLGNGSFTESASPVAVAGLGTNAATLAGRGYHGCARMIDGSVRCWGLNASGQIGDGSSEYRTSPVVVEALPTNVATVAAGASHTCAIVAGAAQCWGYNADGQLGRGNESLYDASPAPVVGLPPGTVTAIAAGYDHACAVVGGAVYCWGKNARGQLGNGTTTDSATPIAVGLLPNGVTMISAGGDHTCAIRAGAASCWGNNPAGELGDGTTDPRFVPTPVTGLDSGVTAISISHDHACAIVNGGAHCWGFALFGQLGNGATDGISAVPVPVTGLSTGVTAIAAGIAHTCAVVAGGAKCWGYDGYGQLGNGIFNDSTSTPENVVGLGSGVTQIIAGDDFSCALFGASAQCWGADYYGDVGNGGAERTIRLVPTPVIGLSSIVASIAAGGTHACAVTTLGGLRCWGNDFVGQLGAGRVLVAPLPLTVVRDDQLFGNAFD